MSSIYRRLSTSIALFYQPCPPRQHAVLRSNKYWTMIVMTLWWDINVYIFCINNRVDMA